MDTKWHWVGAPQGWAFTKCVQKYLLNLSDDGLGLRSWGQGTEDQGDHLFL